MRVMIYLLSSLVLLSSTSLLAAERVVLTPQQERSMGIQTAPLTSASDTRSQRVAAEVVIPIGQERVVSAPQPGLLEQMLVASGQAVKQGQALAYLTSPELLALQREHLQALSQYKLIQNNFQRDNELYKDGIIAERRFLTTQSQYNESTALLQERRQALRLAGMNDAAILEMEKSGQYRRGIQLSAPISGVVIEQMVTAGQRVDASTPIYRIAQLNRLWLEMHVPSNMLGQIKMNMPVFVSQSQTEANVIAIVPSMNRQEQTVLVRALVKKSATALNPGQLVEAEFMVPTSSASGQYSIAKSALVYLSGPQPQAAVFVKEAQGYRVQTIKVIGESGANVVIEGEFSPQALIAISGTALLKAKIAE
jgi:cobalt-zinc-cadmium efflux system membrane fusion protein